MKVVPASPVLLLLLLWGCSGTSQPSAPASRTSYVDLIKDAKSTGASTNEATSRQQTAIDTIRQ